MTYIPFAVLLTVGLIVLTVFGEIKPDHRKKIALINGILAFCGILIIAIVSFAASLNIGKQDAELTEWADDMLAVYYQITFPVFFILLGLILLTTVMAIFDKKQRSGFSSIVRVMASCASSVLLLIIAPFYGFMTSNDSVPLYAYICLLGIGQALAMRLTFIAEYFARSRNVKKV